MEPQERPKKRKRCPIRKQPQEQPRKRRRLLGPGEFCAYKHHTALAAVRSNNPFRFGPRGRQHVLKFISEDMRDAEDLSLRDDLHLFTEAVKVDGMNLQYASDRLRGCHALVSIAVKNIGCALAYASDELKGKESIVMAAVQNARQNAQQNDIRSRFWKGDYNLALQYASTEMRNDRKVVLAAVGNVGLALQYASNELRDDREIVMSAVENRGEALFYASFELKGDEEVVLTAVTSDYRAMECVPDSLWGNTKIVTAAVQGYVYQCPFPGIGIFGDDRARAVRRHVKGIVLPESRFNLPENASPKELASAWLASERLNLCFTSFRNHPHLCLGGTLSDFGDIEEHVVEGWKVVSERANELGECSELLVALAHARGETWQQWLSWYQSWPHISA